MQTRGGPSASLGVANMSLLKVCGITRIEDAVAAAGLGYDAVGLVFAESPRRVRLKQAVEICSSLPPFILRVGVFAGQDTEEVRAVMERCGLDLVQFHGGISAEDAACFASRAIVALRARIPDDLRLLGDYPGVFAVLMDAWDPVLAGGTGKTCDWDLAARAARRARVILAGGLSPANVARAVARVRPFGVDVSSGVESEPGVKDQALMREFARAARDALRAGADEEDSHVG